jgi:hypothetical protein
MHIYTHFAGNSRAKTAQDKNLLCCICKCIYTYIHCRQPSCQDSERRDSAAFCGCKGRPRYVQDSGRFGCGHAGGFRSLSDAQIYKCIHIYMCTYIYVCAKYIYIHIYAEAMAKVAVDMHAHEYMFICMVCTHVYVCTRAHTDMNALS